jgi:hypothetical protein
MEIVTAAEYIGCAKTIDETDISVHKTRGPVSSTASGTNIVTHLDCMISFGGGKS